MVIKDKYQYTAGGNIPKSKDSRSLLSKVHKLEDEINARKHHVKMVKPHKAQTKKCALCHITHYPSQHKSHGKGSMKRAHKKRK